MMIWIGLSAGIDDKESTYTYEDGSGQFLVLADTQERAVKIANERRTIILSHDIWGENEKIEELFFTSKDI